jgi:cysteine-rich CPCC protein
VSSKTKFRELRPLIATILLADWDPIGVADETEARSEYDSYVPGVFGLLAHRRSATDIAEHLAQTELSEMGLSIADSGPRVQASNRLLALGIEHGAHPGPFPCPACGFLTFDEPPGSYSICEVCNWEDDGVQLRHPALRGGANSESLIEAQRRLLSRVPESTQVACGFRRDPSWRPLTLAESEAAGTSLTPEGPTLGIEYNPSLYYWLVA